MRRSCKTLSICLFDSFDMVAAESPESGSARKRQRLSSPTYDDYFPITQEQIQTFEEADKQVSQSLPNATQRAQPQSEESDFPRQSVLEPGDMERDTKETQGQLFNDDKGPSWLMTSLTPSHCQSGWSSSPPVPSESQEQVAEEKFFMSGSGTARTFMSAASLSNPRPALLPFKPPSFKPKLLGRSSELQSALSVAKEASSHDKTKSSGFHLASTSIQLVDDDDCPPTPPPPEPDYNAWFDTDTSVLAPEELTFKSARTILPSSQHLDRGSASRPPSAVGFTSGLVQWQSASHSASQGAPTESSVPTPALAGFTSAAAMSGVKSKLVQPSAETLARAAAKMRQWDEQDEVVARPKVHSETPILEPSSSTVPPSAASCAEPPQTPIRPVLRPMENQGRNDGPLCWPPPRRPSYRAHPQVDGGREIGG